MPEATSNLSYSDTVPEQVRAAFDALPPAPREMWFALRTLILDTAEATDGVGPLSETLKWGEPAYVTGATKSGTPVRLGWKPATPEIVKLLVHCQTDLVTRWRERYGDTLRFEGTRAILLDVAAPLPKAELRHCIAMALTCKLK